MKRRGFLKRSLASSALLVAAGSGVLIPKTVLAAWPKTAFEQKTLSDAMTALLGSNTTTDNDKIHIKAPDIAENGAVVPVSVTAEGIDNVKSISIFADKNANPLAASFDLGEGVEAFVSTRIKMGKSANVVAIVSTGDTHYKAMKEVKITIGGCGG